MLEAGPSAADLDVVSGRGSHGEARRTGHALEGQQGQLKAVAGAAIGIDVHPHVRTGVHQLHPAGPAGGSYPKAVEQGIEIDQVLAAPAGSLSKPMILSSTSPVDR